MRRHRKLSLWVMGGMAAFLLFVMTLALLLPEFLDMEPIRDKILAYVSREVGAKVESKRFALSLIPRPRLVFHRGSLSIPGKVTGTLTSVTIYPEILPLLTGKLRIDMVRVEAPDFKVNFREKPGKGDHGVGAFSFTTIGGKMPSALAVMASKAPDLFVILNGGRLRLFDQKESIFWFEDIRARIDLLPERPSIVITCRSNLWENISFDGRLDSKDLNAEGHIELDHFRPQALMGYLFPHADPRLANSRVNLSLGFRTVGFKLLQAAVQGSIPYLTLYRANEKVVIKGKSLKAAFEMDAHGTTVSLAELDLDYPQLHMTGKFHLDRTSPLAVLQLEGRQVDVYTSREVALALAGDLPITQTIFDIVKGGKVPLITFKTHGNSVADLGETESILIEGRMLEGKIFVPGLDLDLEAVRGEALISHGILEGRNLEAKWENEQGRDGTLRVGLKGENPPFHLDIDIQADLARLPPFLKRFLKSETLVKEIARAYEIRGNAQGRLVLGERLNSITARVDVSEFDLHARYGRIPYDLRIRGGKFTYDGRKIGLTGLSGDLGRSRFHELSARLDLENDLYLEPLSGKFSVLMEEIYPWLSSLEGLDVAGRELKAVQGTVVLNVPGLRGPLLRPRQWRFRAMGEVDNLTADLTHLPGPVAVANGRFRATPEELAVTHAEARVMDALLRVSGTLIGYLGGLNKVDLSFDGNMGPEAIQWASNLVSLPPELSVRPPLSISQGDLLWGKDKETSFSGRVAVKNGPGISLAIHLNPEELRIDRLEIQDEESHASLYLNLKRKNLDVHFNGRLNKKTLDGLLVENRSLDGWIRGDIQAHIQMDHLMNSTARGTLQGAGLALPWKIKAPMKMERVSLDAAGNQLKVKQTVLAWDNSHLTLDGKVGSSKEGLQVDMDLSADVLEWSRIKEIFAKDRKDRMVSEGQDLWGLPLRGVLRLKSEHLTYGKFTWNPFQTDISLDRDVATVTVSKANLCGISTPGLLKATPQDLSLDFMPASTNQSLDPTLDCLWNKKRPMTGYFDLNGKIAGRGRREDLLEFLRGDFEFLARNGRVYRLKLLAKLLAFLNVTEIYRGKLPDLGKEGFGYRTFRVKGNLQNGKLTVKEAIMDGSTMEIVSQGYIDLIAERWDLTVLVAPLKTADLIVRKIPIMRDITGGTLPRLHPCQSNGGFGRSKGDASRSFGGRVWTITNDEEHDPAPN